MNSDPIIYEKNDQIATIWFNRPEAGNRINRALFLGLDKAIDKAKADDDVRVVIIAAKGEDFCLGFDGSDPEACLGANETGEVSWTARRENTQEEIDLWMKIYDLPKPVIGVTQGRSMGGGVLLAFMCDCLIVDTDAEYDNSEFALGMNYTIYTPFDAWKLPMNIAKEKAFTGYSITAEEGYRHGMFNRVVPKDKTYAAALKLAKRMLKLAPYTLTIHKELYNMCYALQGIKNIVPYGKEVFNISLALPGTPENEELWRLAREEGGAAMEAKFREMLVALKEEENSPI